MSQIRTGSGGESWSIRVPSPIRFLRAVGLGAVAGFVATVVMTVYRLPVFRALPPTAEFWARYVGGGDAADHPFPGLMLHAAYGTAAGGIFGGVLSAVETDDPSMREVLALAAGLAYGLALSAFGARVVFVRVLGRELQPEHSLVFHVGHVIYGVTLGTILGTREAPGEVYNESERTRYSADTQLSTREPEGRDSSA